MQEETTSTLEETMMENMSENGVQRLFNVIEEQRSEDDTPLLHLHLEDSSGSPNTKTHEVNIDESEEMEQDVEDMVCNISDGLFLSMFKSRKEEHVTITCITYTT